MIALDRHQQRVLGGLAGGLERLYRAFDHRHGVLVGLGEPTAKAAAELARQDGPARQQRAAREGEGQPVEPLDAAAAQTTPWRRQTHRAEVAITSRAGRRCRLRRRE